MNKLKYKTMFGFKSYKS